LRVSFSVSPTWHGFSGVVRHPIPSTYHPYGWKCDHRFSLLARDSVERVLDHGRDGIVERRAAVPQAPQPIT
jgi:hypothetical protein